MSRLVKWAPRRALAALTQMDQGLRSSVEAAALGHQTAKNDVDVAIQECFVDWRA
jgi:hypothetical protein